MDIDLEHLADAPRFAEFTTLLTKLTGLVMALNSPEGLIWEKYEGREGNPLCRLIRTNQGGLKRCTACDNRYHEKAVRKACPQLYVCHAGFLDKRCLSLTHKPILHLPYKFQQKCLYQI